MSNSLFIPVSKIQKSKHLTGIIFGPTKSRRTSWAVATAPEPVFYFARRGENIEEGLEYYRERDINKFLFGGTMPLSATCIETAEWASGELALFLRAYDEAVKRLTSLPDNQHGTIVIDKGKDLRDLYLLAFFGNYRPDEINDERQQLFEQGKGPKPNRHMAAAWGPVQAAWNKFAYQSRSHDAYDQIIIELEQDEYKGNKTTGNKVVKAGSELDVSAQFMVQTSVESKVTVTGDTKTIYNYTIIHPERFRKNPGTIPDLSFDMVKRLILESE